MLYILRFILLDINMGTPQEYYKIQKYIANDLAWKDIQKTYATMQEAMESPAYGENTRIMRVAGKVREPVRYLGFPLYPSALGSISSGTPGRNQFGA